MTTSTVVLCRLCLKNENNSVFKNIFHDELCNKITACIQLDIHEQDDYPKCICDTCFIKIKEFYDFRAMAIDSNERLHEICHSKLELCDILKCEKSKIKYELVSSSTQTDLTFDMASLREIKKEISENVYEKIYLNECAPSELLNIEIKCEEDDQPLFGHSLSNLEFSNNKLKNSEIEIDDDNIPLMHLKQKKSKTKNQCKNSNLQKIPELSESLKSESESDENISKKKVRFTDSWVCCICSKRCFKKTAIFSHYRSHKAIPPFIGSGVSSSAINDGVDLICKICNQSFSKRTFSKHLTKNGCKGPYICSLCNKTFDDMDSILSHGKDALKTETTKPAKFICDVCTKTFVTMNNLLRHREFIHPDVTHKFVHRCMHCYREFSHLNSLRRHLHGHADTKEFLCYICGKALSSREHLKFHIRIHTGFKPHACKTCGKSFVKKCNLILHERVHSGEKPHVCSYCGKSFSQKSTLVIHERYHTGSKPYVCNYCQKGFVAQGLLSVHLKNICVKKNFNLVK